MFRQCVLTTAQLNVVRKSDGSLLVEGIGGEQYAQSLRWAERISRPLNSTFYFTLQADECLARIRDNLSDVSATLLPVQTETEYYHVPAPLLSGKVQFVTGYKTLVNDDPIQRARDMATVLSNVDLLQPGVYLAAFLILLSFILFIGLRVALRHDRSTDVWLLVRREIKSMFYRRSDHFKWITSLFCLLMFYMMTSFMCLYKTSQIIVETPFFPRTYQESIDHGSSTAVFYNQFAKVSDEFANAPVDSVKGKLYQKMLRLGRYKYFDIEQVLAHVSELLDVVANASKEIEYGSIAIATSAEIRLLESVGCCFSPETELWHMRVFTDPSEKEIIYGFPLAKTFPHTVGYVRQCRRLFEAHLAAHVFKVALDASDMLKKFPVNSREHQRLQRFACSDEGFFLSSHSQVHGIPLSYFKSFIFICLGVWAIAIAIHFGQLVKFRRRNRRLSRRQVNEHLAQVALGIATVGQFTRRQSTNATN